MIVFKVVISFICIYGYEFINNSFFQNLVYDYYFFNII